MSYTVVWNEAPTRALDDALASAAPPEAKVIAEPIETVVVALGESPLVVGESRRDQTTRVFYRYPVTVYYRVIDRLQVVRGFAPCVYRRID